MRLSTALSGVLALLALAPAGAGAVTISPLPGTPDASARTQISFLGVKESEIADVSVVGSRSGSHAGRLRAYVSEPGASFLPTRGFAEGETIRVSASVGRSGHRRRVGTSFTVARVAHYSLGPSKTPLPPKSGVDASFATAPSLHPPLAHVTTLAPGATGGDIFLTSASNYGQAGAEILDEHGRLVWFKPAAAGNTIEDMQVEQYQGHPAIVLWQGHIRFGVGFGTDEIFDSSYRRVASINAGNGYYADLHDVQLTPQGSAYITAYTLVEADLSSAGGPSESGLQDAVMQEIDIPTGLVMYEWHAYGHVALDDSFATVSYTRPWDFFHMNSISLDPWGDGNFMISSRNTWAAYEVDKHTGAVLWRISGRHPSFKMGVGTTTAWQHDARWQSDGTITVFDNGALPREHGESRAIRERIDFTHRTVTLLSRLIHPNPHLLSGSQGDNQVLPDGNSFVGWGEDPWFTEYTPSGQMIFDAHFSRPAQVYRAFRFPWSGTPSTPPLVAVRATIASTATVYASWNGATGVASWRVLGGASATSLAPLASAPSAGFETSVPVASAAAYFAVQALGAGGEVLAGSGAVKR